MELELSDFFSAIYGDLEGYSYLAFKQATPTGKPKWVQEWFHWPSESEKLYARIEERMNQVEVYFGPALYAEKSSQKKDVLGSNVLWAELDGNIPENLDGIPEPSIRVQSSTSAGHEHWYWKLNQVLSVP